eukprot:TRINITY_DN866_c0_g2_i1.p1 TRINITY_DN866_c0_g2~~TRINITY_DN866_c0_g2_i1.p1  ORF type:complete len:406 (-),score=75.47 TRINITY_DN866_c0_g2_i1:1077-2114(-)
MPEGFVDGPGGWVADADGHVRAGPGGGSGGGTPNQSGCLGGLPFVEHSGSFSYCRPGVHFHPGRRIFRLRTPNCLYAFRISDSKDLEHLYYGKPLPLEDDLTYVARANVAAPFDPQPVSAAEALGLRELNDLTVGDQSHLAERWRSFSSQRGSEVGPDGVPLKPRRLENASWRIWGMQRARSHARLHVVDDGTVQETAVDDGDGNQDTLQRRATDGGDTPSSRMHTVSSSTGMASGGGMAPLPSGEMLSPDNLTPDGIVLRNADRSAAGAPGSSSGGVSGRDAQHDMVTPPPSPGLGSTRRRGRKRSAPTCCACGGRSASSSRSTGWWPPRTRWTCRPTGVGVGG